MGEAAEPCGRKNIGILQSNQGPKTTKRKCLTCKNRGCIGHCRFSNATGKRIPSAMGSASRETTAAPRL